MGPGGRGTAKLEHVESMDHVESMESQRCCVARFSRHKVT